MCVHRREGVPMYLGVLASTARRTSDEGEMGTAHIFAGLLASFPHSVLPN